MADLPIAHVAGAMVDWLQRCTRCGAVLNDYRNAAYPLDQGPPRGWAEGATVIVNGNYSWIERGNETRAAVPCGARA